MTNPTFHWKYGKGSTTVIPAMRKFNVIIRGRRGEAAAAAAKHLGGQARPMTNVTESARATHGTVSVEDRSVLDEWFKASIENMKANNGERLPGDLTWFHSID